MIARLRGDLVHREGGSCVLDVSGVGYLVHAPTRALDTWATSGAPVEAWVSTQVRDDDIALYGFPTSEERGAFRVLLGVSGVGPKMALAALDALTVSALATAIEQDDLPTLNRIPGVGRKTAKRLALELKGKLTVSFTPGRPSQVEVSPADPLPLALARLDYGKSEIDRALAALRSQGLADDAELEVRVRAALRYLSGAT